MTRSAPKAKSSIINRGKFGVRYGYTPVLKHLKVLEAYTGRQTCPNCNYDKVFKRVCSGIWNCRKCFHKVASGAYHFGAA